jgi:hypothetical protein
VRYGTIEPPSTGSVTPVTKDAASEQSQRMAAATSTALATRPMGIALVRRCRVYSSANHRSFTGVRVVPGAIALTRMFCLAYSRAAAFVRPTTPCLLAI